MHRGIMLFSMVKNQLLCILFLFNSIIFPLTVSATKYYINSNYGNDNYPGTILDSAWKSLKNLEKEKFLPGDSILFARGSSYVGGFIFTSSGTVENPIVFTSYSLDKDVILKTPRKELSPLFIRYGAGPAPSFSNPDWKVLNGNVFRIEGSHIVIEELYFHNNANPPGSNKINKNVQKLGAIYLALGTHHNTVRNCEFTKTPVAIKIKGRHNTVTHNYIHDTSESMAQSWGPIAIMVVSPYNEIAYNRIENYGSYGGPYGSDGGVIELDGVDDDFNAHNINIHHNTSINNHGFLEIAARNVDSVIVAYNLSDDRNQFIGGGSMKVSVFNNTVIRTREPNVDRFVFWTFSPDSTFLELKNNIFFIAKDMQVLGPIKKVTGHVRVPIGDQKRGYNLFFSPGNPDPIGIPAKKVDIIADPLFVDYSNRNFRLQRNSPAREKGTSLGYTYNDDLDGYPIKHKKKVNLGTFGL